MTSKGRLPRIFVDFAKRDGLGRLKLTTVGAREDIEELGTDLYDGMRAVGYDILHDEEGRRDDLIVEGIVRYNADENIWVLEFNPGAIHQESQGHTATE